MTLTYRADTYTHGRKLYINFTLLLDDAPIGTLLAERKPFHLFYLWNFKIQEQYRNQGYGTAFLKNTISFLKTDYSARAIKLDTNANNSRARHLYESFGFIESGKGKREGTPIIYYTLRALCALND